MYAQVHTAGLFGLNAFPVDVEIEASTGLESFDIVGLADASVRESRDRIKSAFRVTGVRFPKAKVLINLAPADTKKSGSGFDLAITMALLRILEVIKDEAERMNRSNNKIYPLSPVRKVVVCTQKADEEERSITLILLKTRQLRVRCVMC